MFGERRQTEAYLGKGEDWLVAFSANKERAAQTNRVRHLQYEFSLLRKPESETQSIRWRSEKQREIRIILNKRVKECFTDDYHALGQNSK